VSIIDYLQKWDCNKKSEQFAKTYIMGRKKNNMSAVEPHFYRERFVDYMEDNVILGPSSKWFEVVKKKANTI
jgi:hypothetical protein